MNTINITNNSLANALIEQDSAMETAPETKAWYTVRKSLLSGLVLAVSVLLTLLARPEIIDSVYLGFL